VNVTVPLGVMMTPPTTAAATFAVSVTGVPTVAELGEAETVVVLGQVPVAPAPGASAVPSPAIAIRATAT
jgi:hypothetical protein